MDDLFTMASVANAGTESRRVFYSAEIAELVAEIEHKAQKDKELELAREEGRRAVLLAQRKRREHKRDHQAIVRWRIRSAVAGIGLILFVFFISALPTII